METFNGMSSSAEDSQVDYARPNSAQSAQTDSVSGNNIDKIRDILFGSNMRDYEQRFSRLEEALRKESSDLRDTTRRHLESLEAFVHKELAAIETRLNTERAERSESHAAIHRKIGEVEHHEANAKRELRNDLLQQSKELSDALRSKADEIVSLLDRRFHELHHAKTDRENLASLFNEVALRLTGQFKVPGAE